MARNGFSKKAIHEFKTQFASFGGPRRKHTPAAIERRRQDVWEMMCHDLPRSEMAKLLGVSTSLIKLDVKYWKQKGRKRVAKMAEDPAYQDMQAGLIDQKIDSIIAASFQEYSMAKSGNDKYKFLDMATKGTALKIRFLQESGYLKKAGIEVKHFLEKQPSFADRLGADNPISELDNATTRHKLLNLAAQIIDRVGKEDTIDVQAKVIDPPPAGNAGSPGPEAPSPA